MTKKVRGTNRTTTTATVYMTLVLSHEERCAVRYARTGEVDTPASRDECADWLQTTITDQLRLATQDHDGTPPPEDT